MDNVYKTRVADKLLEYRLEEVGAVLIEGPKWCGKTTTAEQKAKSTLYVADPEKQKQYFEISKLKLYKLEVQCYNTNTNYFISRLRDGF